MDVTKIWYQLGFQGRGVYMLQNRDITTIIIIYHESWSNWIPNYIFIGYWVTDKASWAGTIIPQDRCVATIVYNGDGNSEFVCVVHMARIFIKGTTALLLCVAKSFCPFLEGPTYHNTTEQKRIYYFGNRSLFCNQNYGGILHRICHEFTTTAVKFTYIEQR